MYYLLGNDFSDGLLHSLHIFLAPFESDFVRAGTLIGDGNLHVVLLLQFVH